MRILSFDTSSSSVHLSLLASPGAPGDARLHAAVERVIAPASADRLEVASLIYPGIDTALRDAGWSKHDLSLIVVGTGPGSFTGIRVAVIVARTLCQTLKLPLLGISSLEAYGFAAGTPCAVVLSAGSAH